MEGSLTQASKSRATTLGLFSVRKPVLGILTLSCAETVRPGLSAFQALAALQKAFSECKKAFKHTEGLFKM